MSAIGEDRRDPVGVARPGGRRETQRETQNEQVRSHRGHSLRPIPDRSTLSAEPLRTGTMIPQESAAVIPSSVIAVPAMDCAGAGVVEPDYRWIVPAGSRACASSADSDSATGLWRARSTADSC